MLRAALTIARDIAGDAKASGGTGISWIAPDVVGDEEDWTLQDGPVGPGFYSGGAGIAMALAAAASRGAGEDVARVAAAAASDSLTRGFDLLAAGTSDLAVGSSGIAYAVGWVGHLLDDDDLRFAAQELARRSLIALGDSAAFSAAPADYLGGAAGALAYGAAALAGCRDVDAGQDRELTGAVNRIGAAIVAAARPEPLGVSWAPIDDPVRYPGLLGLAHGASGAALALITASRVGGDDELLSTARSAWDYERSWFDAGAPGWPDLRVGSGGLPMVAWCHGAIGMGLARLAALESPPDRLGEGLRFALLAEVGAAVEGARGRVMEARAALRDGKPWDCSLCHGLAGVVDLMLAASRLPGGVDHRRAAVRVAELIVLQGETHGYWPCGLPPREGVGEAQPQPPGLFVGRAGILLALLRASDPAGLPCASIPTSWQEPASP